MYSCLSLLNVLRSCEFIASVFVSQGDLKNAVVIEEKAEAEAANVKGIPDFWFTIFRNVDMLSELVQVSFSPKRVTSVTCQMKCCFFQLIVCVKCE